MFVKFLTSQSTIFLSCFDSLPELNQYLAEDFRERNLEAPQYIQWTIQCELNKKT